MKYLAIGTTLLVFSGLLFAPGCDACTGGLGVCGPPTVRYEGELTRIYPDAPAPNVRVEFVRTGGVSTDETVLKAVTDRDGRFELETGAGAEGEVIGDLIFYPPDPIQPVRRTGVSMTATRSFGGRNYIGSWEIPYPHLAYEATFYDRVTTRPLEGIEITFRRTGGILVEPDTFTVTTNAFGTVKLRPLTEVVGELRGELVVKPLPPYPPYVIGGIRMGTFTNARIDSTIVYTGLGPYLPYAGILVWEKTGKRAANVVLELRRTGGIAYVPESFVTTTDAFGTFHINPTPLGTGTLEGDLVVRSPSSSKGVVVGHFSLPALTLDAPPQFMGSFAIPAAPPVETK